MTDTKDIESDPGFVAWCEFQQACEYAWSAEEWAGKSEEYRQRWDAIALAAHQAHERQAWRSVEEGLPEGDGIFTLAWDEKRGTVQIARHVNGEWFRLSSVIYKDGQYWWFFSDDMASPPTHYRPLPAPPTKGGV